MTRHFSTLLLAFAFAAAPAFAQDCANIPTSAGAVDMAYQHCAQPTAPGTEIGPTDFSFGTENVGATISDFVQNAPETMNALAPITDADFWNAGDFMGDDLTTWYGLTGIGNAYTVDRDTGIQTPLGVIAPPAGETWSGLTWDLTNSQFYGVSTFCGVSSSVSSVDFAGLSSAVIGTDGGVSTCTIAVASNNPSNAAAAHLVYAYDIVSDELISIDITNGTYTVIGPLGYDANFGQGMDFDMDDGTCYIYAFNFGTFQPELRTCDISDGSTTFIGVLGSIVPGALAQVAAGSSVTAEMADCVFRMRIPNPEVDLNTPLEFRVRVEHNRPVTVTRAIFMEILDKSGTVLFQRQTRERTFNYLDVVDRMFSVNLPSRIVPGDYTLDVGLSGMTQGRVQATRAFTVMADGARQAAPESVVSLPGTVEYLAGAWTEAAAQVELPSDYALMQNYPNPFNPSTAIGFTLPESANVRLAVYDVLGRQVQLLLDGTMEAGTHEVSFDASDLPSGTYLYRLETPQGSVVRTMLLAK